MASCIRLHQVSFRYGARPILENIDLELKDREFLGIVGPNGGGKSTLLKLILGLLKPASGQIEVFGTSPRQARHLLGYVPQFATFDSAFPITVRDTVLQGRFGCATSRWRYTAADRAAAEQAMARTDILDLQQRSMLFKCSDCSSNTPIRLCCQEQQEHTMRLRKDGCNFYQECKDCGSSEIGRASCRERV